MNRIKSFCMAFFGVILPVLFLNLFNPTYNSAEPFVLGKTYHTGNWQEIQDMLPPPVLEWVKNGDFVIETGQVEFNWKVIEPNFLAASRQNKNKYRIDPDGYTVDSRTGKRTEFVFGYPFQDIDPKDQNAGEKIIENQTLLRFRSGGFSSTAPVHWVGESGLGRRIIAAGDYLYYQGRYGGPIPNPNNFLQQQMIFVMEPYEVRGTVQMTWDYNSPKESTAFYYIPMLRRIRRMSAAARSDPFMGSDLCTDDAYMWAGKNQTMNWKLFGESTTLVPFTSPKKFLIKEEENGSMVRVFPRVQMGYQTTGWKGAPWAPVNSTWHPRKMWILQSEPKDPYYNYGKQFYYIDRITFNAWYKIIYNKAGEYWKTVLNTLSYQITQNNKDTIGQSDVILAIDDRTHHASYSQMEDFPTRPCKYNMPVDQVGPDNFTINTMLILSK